MLAFAVDWLNLLIRWAHLIAGIGWIGTSFYFIALDNALRRREHLSEGASGSAWEVHGGGFYLVEKYPVAPKHLPDDLLWYKWEAYLTWVTGFALLVVQFYLNPSAWLIDPNVMALDPVQAVMISMVSLALGWLAYDRLCRSSVGKNTAVLAGLVFAFILAMSWYYTHVFSGRGALIHVGALIGTMMALNVFAIIIPNQKKVVASLLAGEKPDPELGAIGKQRSVHNTYLTLPVIVMMVSGHYPMLSHHPQAWLLVGLIIVGGAAVRHFFVRHEAGDPMAKIGWTLPVAGAALVFALFMTAPGSEATLPKIAVSDVEVIQITQKHCVMCHAPKPTHEGFQEPPKGMVLESLDDLRRYHQLIDQFAVKTDTMPLGNETGMTPQDRQKLGAWLAAQ